jgi:threonyl-tRNA synthetase
MSESKERKTLEERHMMSDIERLRHSCAHVMATAICRIWPDAQLAGGPPVENGFYYDMELDHRISPEDFERIEAEMKKVVKSNATFERVVVSRDEALELARKGRLGAVDEREVESKFKIDLLEDIPEGEEISLFKNDDFWDLCAGPHVGRTGNCKAFKVMSVASAFYKGDKDQPMLQRVYGTCFKKHLERLEEAKKRDHRVLGRELGLFHIDEEGRPGAGAVEAEGLARAPGAADLHQRGTRPQGYSQVFTPHIGKLGLYRKSGHFPVLPGQPVCRRSRARPGREAGRRGCELRGAAQPAGEPGARSTATCSSR